MASPLLTLMLVAVTAFWGWSFVLIRQVVGGPAGCPVLTFLTLRFLIAALLLAPFAWRRIPRRLWPTGGLLGLVLAGGYIFQTEGLRFTTPTNSALITGLFVIFVPVWDGLLFRRHLRQDQLLAAVLCLAGVCLLVGHAPDEMRLGDLLTLACAACYGLHISLLSHLARNEAPLPLTLVQMLTVAAVCGAAWPVFEPLAWPAASVWPAILLMALFGSALAFYIQTLVQGRLPALRTALILCMEPLFGALAGFLLAGDRLSPIQIGGAGLIVGTILFDEIVAARRAGGTATQESVT